MSARAAQRRLAAILSADVAGYSRLMAEDEQGTIQTLNAYREAIGTLVEQHHGRVVDSPGDNLLAEFPNALDAVQCAAEIQGVLRIRNQSLPENRRMLFRIGVHLGDITAEGDRIYGDGVNIAARLEGLPEPGGVCISGEVHTQVRGKLGVEYEDLGEQSLKNVPHRVRVYRVLEAAARPTLGLELPDEPSIAVLPFTNMSGDPDQEYFADGISEDLITDLSRLSGLFVISRNSSFTYKGRAVNVGEVGRELGVRCVLEGSVRKIGNRVRITAQLVEASSGRHLWAERYDRELTDVFAVQDEVTASIVDALEVSLTGSERSGIAQAPTDNLEAYDELLRGVWYLDHAGIPEDIQQARARFERALELDPGFAAAHAQIARAYINDWLRRFGEWDVMERAFAHARKAIELDEGLATAHSALARAHSFAGQHDEGIAEAERAVSLDPGNAQALRNLGAVLSLAGQAEEALRALEKAKRLDPHAGPLLDFELAVAHRQLGNYEESSAGFKRAYSQNPEMHMAPMNLAALYAQLGDEANAKRWLEELLRAQPGFTLASVPRFRFRDPADTEWINDGLRKAGLKG